MPILTTADRGIRRPRRPGDPVPVEQPIIPIAAPVISAPRERNLSAPTSIPTPAPVAAAQPNYQPQPMVAGPDANEQLAAEQASYGVDPEAEHARMGVGTPETPGTRHGLWGRLKDFAETLLYTGGNPIAAGIAAASPGTLARYKWNQFEQPARAQLAHQQAALQGLQQQAQLRQAQQRKAEQDAAENTAMLPYRQRQMVANTTKAEAEADKAWRTPPTPRVPLEKLDTDQGPMRWNPDTQRAEPILGANGQPVGRYEKPVKEPGLTPYQQYQVGRDVNKDAQEQDKEARAIAADFEKSKKIVTALDTEKNELADASGQKPNAKGMVSYKGRDYSPAELLSMAKQKEAEWQAAQAEFNGQRQRASQHPGLELDQSGVGIRFKSGRPQATGATAGGGSLDDKIKRYAASRGITEAQARAAFAAEGFR